MFPIFSCFYIDLHAAKSCSCWNSAGDNFSHVRSCSDVGWGPGAPATVAVAAPADPLDPVPSVVSPDKVTSYFIKIKKKFLTIAIVFYADHKRNKL